MGTRFAGHRVRKSDWESFRARLRDHYLAEHSLPALARELAAKAFAKPEAERPDAYLKALELVRKACAELGPRAAGQPIVSLQLFDRRTAWLFRFLERDWFGDNALAANGIDWHVEDVWYDDHTDMAPAMRRLRPMVLRIDEDIDARRYLVAPILAEDDVINVFHDEYRRLVTPGRTARKVAGGAKVAPKSDEAERILRLHLGSRHALGNWPDAPDPADIHEHEHDGPGTIRNHPREDCDYDLAKALDVAVEASEPEGDMVTIVGALTQAKSALPAVALAEYETLSRFGPEVAGF